MQSEKQERLERRIAESQEAFEAAGKRYSKAVEAELEADGAVDRIGKNLARMRAELKELKRKAGDLAEDLYGKPMSERLLTRETVQRTRARVEQASLLLWSLNPKRDSVERQVIDQLTELANDLIHELEAQVSRP